MTESDPDRSGSPNGAEPPDDGWPQLERRDWSTRPSNADLSADDPRPDTTDRPEHDLATPATDTEPEPDEPGGR